VSEPQERFPFQEWVEAARPAAQLWRTVVGVIIIAGAWMVWSFVVILGALMSGLVSSEAFKGLFGLSQVALSHDEMVVVLLVALASIWGFAFGVWGVVKLFHRRPFMSVVAWDRRFSFGQFGIGCMIAAGYLAVSMGISVATGNVPRRSDLDIGAWLLSLAPIAVVLFTQAASEELMFRGYLPQQLAARFRSPIVWGLLPSLAFGLLHAGNAPGSAVYAAYYVVIAAVMGLMMVAMVWRTGSLAAGMGFHFINNFGALVLAGNDAGSSSLSLFVWSADDLIRGAPTELLLAGLMLAFVLSPWAPLPKKGQLFTRRKDTRAAP
jgi:membrane protease YdiL (CAAX protease family)